MPTQPTEKVEATPSTTNSTRHEGILARNISKCYPDPNTGEDFYALRNVDIDVSRGEFVCLVGPSGCGKSTLLNIIAGFEQQDEGTVEVGGRTVNRPAPDRIMVFQDYALFPWMNTIQNVQFGLRIQGVNKKERKSRAMEALELVGLGNVARRAVYQLSGGMKQRVALARALVMRPEVLLMDEPFAAIDAQQRTVLQQELVRIWRETAQTILFVTHNLDEAIYLGDRINVFTLDPGRIVKRQNVDLSRPRDETSGPFNEIKRELWSVLEQDIKKAEEMAGTSGPDEEK